MLNQEGSGPGSLEIFSEILPPVEDAAPSEVSPEGVTEPQAYALAFMEQQAAEVAEYSSADDSEIVGSVEIFGALASAAASEAADTENESPEGVTEPQAYALAFMEQQAAEVAEYSSADDSEIVGDDRAWSEIVGEVENEIVGDAEDSEILGDDQPGEIEGVIDDLPGVVGDAEDSEILGESDGGDRGAILEPVDAVLPDGSSIEILGELVRQSQAFRDYINRRAGATRLIVYNDPLNTERDWQIDFGPASAPAGEVLTFFNSPQCLFRGEKVIATDTGSPAGTGTRIQTITVGQKVQRPAGRAATLTSFFANNALGNGIKWDTSDRALTIAVTVSFIQSCTFDMSVFGRAVL